MRTGAVGRQRLKEGTGSSVGSRALRSASLGPSGQVMAQEAHSQAVSLVLAFFLSARRRQASW